MRLKIVNFGAGFVLLAVGLANLFGKSRSENRSWVIDSQQEWTEAMESSESLDLIDGLASSEEETAFFRSKLRRFDEKRSFESIEFTQSAIWQNWNPVDNLGPKKLGNAPVILSLGPKNIWMFGRYGSRKKKDKRPVEEFVPQPATLEGFDGPLWTTAEPNVFTAQGGRDTQSGGYHAWQSADMKTWIHHGAVTGKVGKWVTTAEYADGILYIYYDYPNDQDPHVFVDDNLTDGKPGVDMGMAFQDPTHGSDAAVIRDREGRFHLIYEDWSPINARKRSWDSPLAGRAVSDDGLKNFAIQAPAVDERTEPTGEVAEYRHPSWASHPNFDSNMGQYNVHSPEQEAYGDWAAIEVGGQYYLFGDYDPAGGHQMSVGWFTSPSLDEQFVWCDNIGKGHPDPDVCFANGLFYLVTQQSTDYTSPGPWVETVSARVGVDTDNDGKADYWSKWQDVKETYSYVEGFAKQVDKSPAIIDLRNLPVGYGIQFEIKMEDSTANKSKPILDMVVLNVS